MRRTAFLVVAALALLCFAQAQAQAQTQPQVSVELSAESTLLGQPLLLRVSVLVPTFMPDPPVFPEFDLPGIIVRQPQRTGGPISGDVNGETWSGVQRAYRIIPLRPGRIELSGQPVRVTFAGDGASNPQTAEVTLDPVEFTVEVPEAAQGLDPLIVATGFQIDAVVSSGKDEAEENAAAENTTKTGSEQTPDTVAPMALKIGDAITRTVTAKIDGTTPVLIPILSPVLPDPGLRAYPDEPVVTEAESRGVLSGQRVERVTYMAAAPGEATVPKVSFDWFNLESGTVETAEIPEITVTIAAGPASGAAREAAASGWAASLAALLAIGVAFWRLWPRLRAFGRRRWHQWLTSEAHARRTLRRAVQARDLASVYTALTVWHRFGEESSLQRLDSALAGIGYDQYANVPDTRTSTAWKTLSSEIERVIRARRDSRRVATALPDLNPSR